MIKAIDKLTQATHLGILLAAILLFIGPRSTGQINPSKPDAPPPVPPCTINGAATVACGSSSVYTISGCSATGWSVTCGGTVLSWNASSATIEFNSVGCGTVQVSATGTTATPKTVTITSSALNGGTINNPNQTIAYSATPAQITATGATGGGCLYAFAYQWYSSIDGVNYTVISGATAQNYQPGQLTITTYYYRKVTSGSATANTSNIATVTVQAHDYSYNFIQERIILKPGVSTSIAAATLTSDNDVSQVTQFFDGLGRKLQAVEKQKTPMQNDLVSYSVYDNFGRESTRYLPYAASTNDGFYKTTFAADQNTFNSVQFPGEQDYYGQNNFEASPLNRPTQTLAPGLNWVGSGRGISEQYLFNTAGDSVQQWTINSQQGSIATRVGPYPAGTLYKNITTDEQGNSLVEYNDMSGHTILRKMQATASPSSGHFGWLCTYFVYDTLQNLRFVIQPQAVADINGSWSISTTIASELCFRYEYDGRRRLCIKKSPGAGETWIVYDARNREVMIQDSGLRAQQKWLFTKYDLENRPDSTGTITDPGHYSYLAYHDSLAYYSINYPAVSSFTNELLTMKFYDDYSWVSTYGAPVGSSMSTTYTGNGNYFITSYNTSPAYAVAPTSFPITRGMPTGGMKKVLGTVSQYLYTANFYDDRGRVIQSQSQNFTSAIDTVTVQYGFLGAVLRSLLNHGKGGNTPQSHVVATKMDYDQEFRLRHIWKNIDNAPADQLIDSIQYNELGQLRAKYLGNNVDSLIYDYNIRGWLIGINKNYVAGTTNHYFGMEVGYDKTTSVAPGNTYVAPEYNGNIEGTVWKTAGSAVNRKYDFVYDNANRLDAANFTQYNGSGFDLSAGVNFSTTNLSYDANGNILTMRQYGFMVGGSNPIDELQYSYQPNSNKLNQVYDTANSPTSQLGDFHWTGTKQSSDYGYDGNGNQTFDNNRGISYVHYNNLSLADSIVFMGKGYIKYVYDASGKRLQKATVDNVANKETVTTYIGGFVYSRSTTPPSGTGGVDTLQLMAHEEGRIRWAYHRYINGTAAYKFEYDFYEKDKQGNIRMVLTQEHDTTNYLASMEAAYRSTEQALFGNLLSTCYAWSSVPNSGSIPSGTKLAITNPNDSVAKVDYTGSAGQTNGPSLLLKVMGGDTVSIGVQSFYNSNTITTTNSSLSNVLSSLATALVATPTGGAEGTYGGFTSNGGSVYAGLSSFLSTKDPAPPSGYPKAYLNWIFLDDQFNYISGSSGSVAAASSNYPAATLNPVAPGGPIVMPKNGYLYVWVSNETQGWDVFFDNLSVQYKQGPVLEENHYYPFGLTMAGISDKAMKGNYAENKYRYNAGSELQNKEFSDGSGWEMYEDPLRGYDAQIGRFAEIDPLCDKFNPFSTYQYALDNPITYNDPTGAGVVLSPAVIKLIDQMLDQAGPGFSQFILDDNGQPVLTFYDANPTVGSFQGQSGLWFNIISGGDDGYGGHYMAYNDAFNGGQMNTATYTHKFISLPTLQSDFTDYMNKPGFWDYAKAVGNVALGGVEIVASGLTGGLAAPILGVDGASRVVLGLGKIVTLATEGKTSAEDKPATLLGVVGSVIGGPGSKWQKGGDVVDNVGAMLLSGGLIGEGGVYSEATAAFAAGKTGEALVSTADGIHMVANTYESYENTKAIVGSKQ